MSVRGRLIYTFGPFSIDAAAKILLRGGEPVKLSRKAVETLLALVENSGRVLTKDELIAAVWPDRVVDEANLAQNIAVIRRALAAERGSPAFIETFAGRGYRLLGPVTAIEKAPPADGDTPAHPPAIEAASFVRSRPALTVFILAGIAVSAAAWWMARGRAAVPPPAGEFHRVPVTRFAGKESQPAVSPDGSRVAFVWEDGPTRAASIWVQEAGESSPRAISQSEGTCSSPAWSPDGRSIAYMCFGNDSAEVIISPAEGGQGRTVARVFQTRYGLPDRHLDWSPDGERLVVNDASSQAEPLGLFLVSIATGEKTRLTQPEPPYVGDVDPRFSPDGKTIAFTRAFHRAWQELFVIPAAGGGARQLTSDGRQVSGHDWTPDGQAIVFGSDRDGDFKIWRIQPGGSSRPPTPHATGIFADYRVQLSLARRAPVLVYSVLQQDRNIWRLDLKEGGAARWARVISSPVSDASPQFAPSGDRILFRSDRSGEEQLWVSAADGSDPVQITVGSERPSVGRWSPDGRMIVFNSSKDPHMFVAVMRPDGKWDVRATGIEAVHPVFSADGKWIYAGLSDRIMRMPVEGGEPQEAARIGAISLGTSADGRFLYFVRDPAGTALWSLEIATQRTAKVLEGLVPYCSSCWAVAPSGIYYLGEESRLPGKQALYFHDFAGGRDRLVMEYPEPLLPIGSGPFSLSPDGRYLLCVRMDPSNSDITKIEPFR